MIPITWRCDYCGLFMSHRTAWKHRICQMNIDKEGSGVL